MSGLEQVRALLAELPGKVSCEVMVHWPLEDQVTLCWWDKVPGEGEHPLEGFDYKIIHDEGEADTAIWRLLAQAIPTAERVIALEEQNAALSAELAVLRAQAQAVAGENVKLSRDLADERRSHSNTIDSRDRAQEAADRLAYAAFDIDDIGEHSSANCPWGNAAELLEDHAGGVHELVFGPALAQVSQEGNRGD